MTSFALLPGHRPPPSHEQPTADMGLPMAGSALRTYKGNIERADAEFRAYYGRPAAPSVPGRRAGLWALLLAVLTDQPVDGEHPVAREHWHHERLHRAGRPRWRTPGA